MFGEDPVAETHENFIHNVLPERQAEIRLLEVPLLIGEWNPVFEYPGGGDLMRRDSGESAQRGWAATT